MAGADLIGSYHVAKSGGLTTHVSKSHFAPAVPLKRLKFYVLQESATENSHPVSKATSA